MEQKGDWAMAHELNALMVGKSDRVMLQPTPQLPNDTSIHDVQFSPEVRLTTRIRNVLSTAGLKTIGEVRGAPDAMLKSLPDMGGNCIALLRQTLGSLDRWE